jgi:hypothetical protein
MLIHLVLAVNVCALLITYGKLRLEGVKVILSRHNLMLKSFYKVFGKSIFLITPMKETSIP